GQRERVDEKRRRDDPGDVDVVGGEEHAVRSPVAAAEDTVHARQEKAAEEQLFSERGVEHEEGEDEGEPAPVPIEEALTGIRVEKAAEVPVLRNAERRQQRFEREQRAQRDQDQPQLASDALRPRAAWRAKPERFAERRPAEAPLLEHHETGDESELPDQTGAETEDQSLRH